MLGSNWLRCLVVRAWLLASLLIWTPTLGQPPDGPLEQSSQVENIQGTPVEPPAPEQGNSPGSTEADSAPVGESLPPAPPVQSEVLTPPPCDERCQAAEQRDQDYLTTQLSIADSTGHLAIATYLQFGAGILGFVALLGTLYFARQTAEAGIESAKASGRSAEAAHEAVRIAEKSFFTNNRPLMIFEEVSVIDVNRTEDSGWVNMKLTAKNRGKTVATNVGFELMVLHQPAWEDLSTSHGRAVELIEKRERTSRIVEQMTVADDIATGPVSAELPKGQGSVVLYVVCYKSIISDRNNWLYTVQSGTIREDETGGFRIEIDRRSNIII